MPDLHIRMLESQLANAQAIIEEIRELHIRNTYYPNYCRHCRAPWPCRTIQVLDGDGAA